MSEIYVIDDDFAVEPLVDSLGFSGHTVTRIDSATKALERLNELAKADLVIVDIMMECPTGLRASCAHGGHRTGHVLIGELRKRNANLPVVVFSGTQDSALVDELRNTPGVRFISKLSPPSPTEIVRLIGELCGASARPSKPRAFIVHGHDEAAKLQLKNYLQNTLGLPEPVVLHEQPSGGKTLIEKFESYAWQGDFVFVLLTPDDKAPDPQATVDDKRRSRQNVIFEMGYFLGRLGRHSGRVILLYSGPIELPSDIAGIIYIDIAHGIDAAGEQIRRELSHDV